MSVSDRPVTVIEARTPTLLGQIKAVWRYRHLYGFLFREISMHRYKQTMLGFWWLILRPLIPAIVTVTIFTAVVPMETHGEPYPVFFLASYVAWNMFQAVVTLMPRSLNWMRGMMRRTYFPKLLLPFASLGPPLMEGLVVLAVLAAAVVLAYLNSGTWWINAGPGFFWFPVCAFFALLLGVAVGMVLSVLAAFMRDVIYTAPYFVQIFMLVTPVMYPIKFVPEGYRWIVYVLNPMASFVETTRWALTGSGTPPLAYLWVSIPITIVLLLLATWFYVRAEPYMSDQV